MQVMKIGTNNLEENMAAMKVMLERLVKESEEKEASMQVAKWSSDSNKAGTFQKWVETS